MVQRNTAHLEAKRLDASKTLLHTNDQQGHQMIFVFLGFNHNLKTVLHFYCPFDFSLSFVMLQKNKNSKHQKYMDLNEGQFEAH